jgi:hypothetical protein
MCLLREFWTTYRTSELQNRIYAPQFEQILTSLKRKFAFSHSLGRERTPLQARERPDCKGINIARRQLFN